MKEYSEYGFTASGVGFYCLLVLEVKNGNIGHVWICDGLRYDSYTDTEYNLFVLNHLEYPDFDYICIETQTDDIYTTTPYCHMNWGWGGNHDGWFLGENWNSGNGNFLREKKIIY